MPLKRITFLGGALDGLRDFPTEARREAGHQLDRVQPRPGRLEADDQQPRLNDLLRGKNANEDAYLSPGDSIFVPEKFITKFRKYIPYGIGTSISPSPAFY